MPLFARLLLLALVLASSPACTTFYLQQPIPAQTPGLQEVPGIFEGTYRVASETPEYGFMEYVIAFHRLDPQHVVIETYARFTASDLTDSLRRHYQLKGDYLIHTEGRERTVIPLERRGEDYLVERNLYGELDFATGVFLRAEGNQVKEESFLLKQRGPHYFLNTRGEQHWQCLLIDRQAGGLRIRLISPDTDRESLEHYRTLMGITPLPEGSDYLIDLSDADLDTRIADEDFFKESMTLIAEVQTQPAPQEVPGTTWGILLLAFVLGGMLAMSAGKRLKASEEQIEMD